MIIDILLDNAQYEIVKNVDIELFHEEFLSKKGIIFQANALFLSVLIFIKKESKYVIALFCGEIMPVR